MWIDSNKHKFVLGFHRIPVYLYLFLVIFLLTGCDGFYEGYTSFKELPDEIRSFNKIPWGANQKELLSSIDKGFQSDTITTIKQGEGNFRRIQQSEEIWGLRAKVEYLFHKRKGLSKGIYIFHFSKEINCNELYEKVAKRINSNFPSLERKHAKRINNLDHIKFCRSVMVGQADRRQMWKHPDFNFKVKISFALSDDPEGLAVHFETPFYLHTKTG